MAKSQKRDIKTVSMQPGELRTAAKRAGVPVSAIVKAKEDLDAEGKHRHTRADVMAKAKANYGMTAKAVNAAGTVAKVLTGNVAKYKPGDSVKIGKTGKKTEKVEQVIETEDGHDYKLHGKKNLYVEEQLRPA